MKYAHSAGGIILNKENKVAVVNQDGYTWAFPKGGIKEGEDELTAAKREVWEETGLKKVELIKKLGSYQRNVFNNKGEIDKSVLKTITMFLFKTEEEELKPVDLKNPEAKWLTKKEVIETLSHKEDKEWFIGIAKSIGL
ncbi:MAG: NUDIX domain-containing protein [Patescibacteria group bacterium]